MLSLCREAGLVSVGVIAIDGTKIKASASRDQNRSYESIVAEILDQAERTHHEEDERHGDARGDELPERFRSRESRRATLAEAAEARSATRESAATGRPLTSRASGRGQAPAGGNAHRGASGKRSL